MGQKKANNSGLQAYNTPGSPAVQAGQSKMPGVNSDMQPPSAPSKAMQTPGMPNKPSAGNPNAGSLGTPNAGISSRPTTPISSATAAKGTAVNSTPVKTPTGTQTQVKTPNSMSADVAGLKSNLQQTRSTFQHLSQAGQQSMNPASPLGNMEGMGYSFNPGAYGQPSAQAQPATQTQLQPAQPSLVPQLRTQSMREMATNPSIPSMRIQPWQDTMRDYSQSQTTPQPGNPLGINMGRSAGRRTTPIANYSGPVADALNQSYPNQFPSSSSLADKIQQRADAAKSVVPPQPTFMPTVEGDGVRNIPAPWDVLPGEGFIPKGQPSNIPPTMTGPGQQRQLPEVTSPPNISSPANNPAGNISSPANNPAADPAFHNPELSGLDPESVMNSPAGFGTPESIAQQGNIAAQGGFAHSDKSIGEEAGNSAVPRYYAQMKRMEDAMPRMEAELQSAISRGDRGAAKRIQNRISVNKFNLNKLREQSAMGLAENLNAPGYSDEQRAQMTENFKPGGTVDWAQQRSENVAAGRPTNYGVIQNRPSQVLSRMTPGQLQAARASEIPGNAGRTISQAGGGATGEPLARTVKLGSIKSAFARGFLKTLVRNNKSAAEIREAIKLASSVSEKIASELSELEPLTKESFLGAAVKKMFQSGAQGGARAATQSATSAGTQATGQAASSIAGKPGFWQRAKDWWNTSKAAPGGAASGAAPGAAKPGMFRRGWNWLNQDGGAVSDTSTSTWKDWGRQNIANPAMTGAGFYGAGGAIDAGAAAAGYDDPGLRNAFGAFGVGMGSPALRRFTLGTGTGWTAGYGADTAARMAGIEDTNFADYGAMIGGGLNLPGTQGLRQRMMTSPIKGKASRGPWGQTAGKHWQQAADATTPYGGQVNPHRELGVLGSLKPWNYHWNPFKKGLDPYQRASVGLGTLGTAGMASAGLGALTGVDPLNPKGTVRNLANQQADQFAQQYGFANQEAMRNSPMAQLLTGFNSGNLMQGVQNAWGAMSPEQKTQLVTLVGAGIAIPTALGMLSAGSGGLGAAVGLGGLAAGAYGMSLGDGTMGSILKSLPQGQSQALTEYLQTHGLYDRVASLSPNDQSQFMRQLLEQLQGQASGQELQRAQGGAQPQPEA
jgi:hypothetical protein